MIENSILKKNRQGLKALVLSLTFPSTEAIELAGRVGFDAVNLDGEHGSFSSVEVELLTRVAHGYGMSVTARVPSIDPWQINLWLDRGLQGILGPHVESGADAQKLADACLFPPDGWRSWGGGRGTLYNEDAEIFARHDGKLGFAKWANANMIVMAQIESKKAYDNLDEILAVKGLTYIAGGPNDFAASLGHPGEPDHPERQCLTAEIDQRARAAGKKAGGDMIVTLDLQSLILGAGREFVAEHKDDKADS
jgi:2-keto-3-deoxy-L-rhamnonate aldolase RhmA